MNGLLRGLCAFGAGTALTLGAAQVQATVLVPVDPDGAGGSQGTVNVSSLDWNVGNALAVNGVTATNNFVSGTGSTKTTVYVQSTLSALNTPGGTVTPSVEWTIVGAIPEAVTGAGIVGGTSVGTFGFDATGATGENYIKIYADASPDANNLAGTGFNDGTLILLARVTNVSSNFAGTGLSQRLDNFLTDNYPGVSTIAGVGATDLTADVVSWDPNYIQLPAGPGNLHITLFNGSQVLPFNQVDPSAQFVNDAGGAVIPNTGAVNGVTGPDIRFQADANQAFDTIVIPEPMTGMLSLGLAGLLVLASRRRR